VPAAYGIIVPVRNEALLLPVTVPRLLAATAGDRVRIVWVCNGCTDDSAAIIRRHAGPAADVIDLAAPGKTAALQAGDARLGDLFPRFYMDADCWVRPGDMAALVLALQSGAADLVAPALDFDMTRSSWLSRQIAACWLALPHGRNLTFSFLLGLSAAGRAHWGDWPDVTGDDIFVSATIPAARRQRVSAALATSPAPTDFRGWVRMRARWRRGEAELTAMGLTVLRHPGQYRALIGRMLRPTTAIGAWAFVTARLAAHFQSVTPATTAWLPDRRRDATD
jgi:hypothetical protein